VGIIYLKGAAHPIDEAVPAEYCGPLYPCLQTASLMPLRISQISPQTLQPAKCFYKTHAKCACPGTSLKGPPL
jgi:hypothetical protein